MLWNDKYRPNAIHECVLPDRLDNEFDSIIETGNLPDMIMVGKSGVGKTTVAKILCNTLKCDYIEFNGSNGELNIDKLRDDLTEFASTVPLSGRNSIKVVLIDEADGLSRQIQQALRNFMEKYSNTRFILTCNYPEKIISPIWSRSVKADFNFTVDEKNKIVRGYAVRLKHILDAEGVDYDITSIGYVCKDFFPDFRRVIGESQRYIGYNGRLDSGIQKTRSESIHELYDGINGKNFDAIKQWSANNNLIDVYDNIFKTYEEYINKDNQLIFIMCMGEGAKHHLSVPNQELNFLSTVANYMENV